MNDYETKGITEKSKSHQIIKFIFDLSKEMNIEGTCGVVGNELELITLVRNCRFLYDKSLSDFKDVRKKNAAWGAIANVMHTKVQEVQQRWRSLREGYNKYKKELESTCEVRPWEFYEDMKFIEPYIVPRRSTFIKTSSSIHQNEEVDTADESTNSNQEHNSDILHLIECIKLHPVLYDCKDPNFKIREYKIQAWNEVAQTVCASTSECEIKWKTLRERYGRERKLREMHNEKQQQWEYYDALSFLNGHIKSRRHSIFRPILPKPQVEETETNNITVLDNQPTFLLKSLIKDGDLIISHCENRSDEANFADTSNAVQTLPCSPVPANDDTQLHGAENDEDELFGQTITAELRRLPSGKKKMKIKAEIYKILYENESEEET